MAPPPALLIAAREGDVNRVIQLLEEEDTRVNQKDHYGDTPLIKAIDHFHHEIVDILMGVAGIGINSRNRHGYSPLIRAAITGNHYAALQLVWDRRIDVNQPDYQGNKNIITPLSHAVLRGHHRVVEVLLQHQAIKVNIPCIAGYTPLHNASMKGHHEIVDCLLRHKDIEVNEVDKMGRTALYMAASRGHVEVVKLLLQHKDTKLDLAASDGETALSIAVTFKHAKVVELLLRKGDTILENEGKEEELCNVCMDLKLYDPVPCANHNLCRPCVQKAVEKLPKDPSIIEGGGEGAMVVLQLCRLRHGVLQGVQAEAKEESNGPYQGIVEHNGTFIREPLLSLEKMYI